MRLFDNLRSAEKKSMQMMRQGMARAREEWGDVERRIRQGMRIYPQKTKKRAMAAIQSPVELGADVPAQEKPQDGEPRKPIVSVHGHDVRDEELGKPSLSS